MKQTSIADGSDESSPYAERRRQYEIRDSAVARDQVPYEQEDGERNKAKSNSFGHVFSKPQSSRRARRILSSFWLALRLHSDNEHVITPLSAMAHRKNKAPRRETLHCRSGQACGARNQTSVDGEANKNPENKLRFRGLKSNQTRVSLSPSFIQTVTVGSGIHLHRTACPIGRGAVQVSPDHASND